MIIHPKHPTADDTYYIGGAWAPACITAKDKRFSDAELAAEYWRAELDVVVEGEWGSGITEPLQAERDTIHRFLTLPNYDEERA